MMLAVHKNKLEHRHLVLPRNLDYSGVPSVNDILVGNTDALYRGMREQPVPFVAKHQ
jgi:hypothetical protein